MNRVDRLLALILYLQSRPLSTAEEMAEHFHLSIRTIYRDMAALGEAGVPITAEAGMGYSLTKGYHLPPVSFTAEEASALTTGGMLVESFADASLKSQVTSALMKVRAVLPRAHQAQMFRLEKAMATTAKSSAPAQVNLTLLQQALARQRVLRFHYQGWNKTTTELREAEPLGLIHYLERWHLIAWCRQRGAYRDFRTDRMTRVTLLDESFATRPDFSIADYLRTMPQPDLRARVRFTPESADRAKREWWLGIVDEETSLTGCVLTLAAVSWEGLVGWLLSFGCEADVLEPASLRGQLSKAAKEAAAHHSRRRKAS